MDIQEIKQKKKELESKISRLIESFQKDTKTNVYDVELKSFEIKNEFGQIISSDWMCQITIRL